MNELIVAGIDPGLVTTGLAVLRFRAGYIPEITHFEKVTTTAPKGLKGRAKLKSDRERSDNIANNIIHILGSYENLACIAFEDFVFMGNRGAAESQLVRLVENMRLSFAQAGYETAIYDNAYWKDVLMKCRTANKEQVKHFICRTLQLEVAEWDKKDKGGHLLDAVGLALAYVKLLKLKGVAVPWQT